MWRRVAPAIGLFLLAPLVAEYLLGNLPITMLSALFALAPMYGGGALLIREVARRRRLGWTGIVALALAYGILEEGFTTQSLFNPDYAGQRLLDPGYLPALGIGAPWTLFVLALHTVFSISVPIALVEGLARGRRTTPWLGRVGLTVTAVLFAFGIAATTAFSLATYPYVASVGQFAGAAVLIVLLVALAFRRPAVAPAPDRSAPSPWVVGLTSLAAGAVFETSTWLPSPWANVGAFVVLFAAVTALVVRWSSAAGWGDAHRLALAGGALLTYAWHAFVERPLLPVSATVDLIGDVVFGLGAVVLLVVSALRLREGSSAVDGDGGVVVRARQDSNLRP
jgi:hypothetical protein